MEPRIQTYAKMGVGLVATYVGRRVRPFVTLMAWTRGLQRVHWDVPEEGLGEMLRCDPS